MGSEMEVLILDIETTGLPPKGAHYEKDYADFPRIISIAWKVNDEPTVEYIINQEGFEIPAEVIEIHGITNEKANESTDLLPDVLDKLLHAGANSKVVVGHGLYFDTSIIKANALRIKKQEMYEKLTELLHKDKRVDTMQRTTKFCGLGKWPKLIELYQKLFDEKYETHVAANDVDAIYRCYKRLVELGVVSQKDKDEDKIL